MIKKILVTVFGLLILIAIIGGIKVLQIVKMNEASKQFAIPPEPVSTVEVRAETWENLLNAVGSLTAVQGVNVSAELPSKVVEIAFIPGTRVKKGQLLLRQDTSSEQAELPGTEATLKLAEQTRNRFQQLIDEKLVSQTDLDAALAGYQQALANVNTLNSRIAKKTIRAPFAGRLGIRQVNLGQMLREGEPIVSLQSLDPIFVDFKLPQQQLQWLETDLPVRVTADGIPDRQIEGLITTINPQIDAATLNVGVQATLKNQDEILRPGMFVSVEVVLPERQQVMAIPTTAVLYAPFGDSVYIVEEKTAEEGKAQLVLRQQFVRLGAKRGDFIIVLSGLQGEETLVSTGVFKLRNGQTVIIDNSLAPEFNLRPQPENN